MKKSVVIESNNVEDLEELYTLYYTLKGKFENIQTLSFKITLEIEAI